MWTIILLIIMAFGVVVAVLAACLVVSPRKAATIAGGVAFAVPSIALLYVGHRVGITLLDLILVAVGSAALASFLKVLFRHMK